MLFWVQRQNATRAHERQLCSSGEDAELYTAQIPAHYGGPTGHSAGPFMPRSLHLTVTVLTHLEVSDQSMACKQANGYCPKFVPNPHLFTRRVSLLGGEDWTTKPGTIYTKGPFQVQLGNYFPDGHRKLKPRRGKTYFLSLGLN